MRDPARILVVDDNEANLDIARARLESLGYEVVSAVDGEAALDAARDSVPDLILLDIMMPKLDGIEATRRLKADRALPFIPIILVTAKADAKDVVAGLEAGGDDYLTKPFAFSELLARVEALLRRTTSTDNAPPTRLKVSDLEMDLLSRRVLRSGREIELTAREFKLLEFLLRHAGQVVTRTMLLEGVWDLQFDPQTNLIDVHMSRLRQAVDRGFPKPLIHTVRGAGYVIRDEDKPA